MLKKAGSEKEKKNVEDGAGGKKAVLLCLFFACFNIFYFYF